MSIFAGLVSSDAACLRAATSAWHLPPAEHALVREWQAGPALLRQWQRPAARSDGVPFAAMPDEWQVLADCRLGDPGALASAVGYEGSLDGDGPLCAAFQRWEDGTPHRIGGEFALAAWHPERSELFLARDAIGGRPIYYHRMGDGLAFATDLPLLLRLPFVSHALNARTIAAILTSDPCGPITDTYYEDIHLLPAGHDLSYGKNGLTIRRWWQPRVVEIRRPDPEAGLRDAITTAVEERMRDGRHIAVHLSGGLDSSAVACLAARRLKQEGRRLLAISSVLPAGWSGPETDERAHVEAVLAQEDNIDIHWLDLPKEHDPFAACEQGFALLGQPAFSNSSHIEEQFGLLGRKLGVDVVLSGFGGDFFASWRGQGVVQTFWREGHWRQAAAELAAMHRRRTGTWPRLIKRQILAPVLAAAARRGTRADLKRLAFMHPREQMRFVAEPGRMELVLNAGVQFFDRGFGQSLRFPLLDPRIIAFMQSQPADELQRDGETRSLFRRAMKGIVPETVRQRRDKGPAFDPIIVARVTAARKDLQDWAARTRDAPCWSHVDRARFLRELAATRPTARSGWRAAMFQDVMTAGRLARFIEWNAQQGRHAA